MKRFCISETKNILMIRDRKINKTFLVKDLNDTAKKELLFETCQAQYEMKSCTNKPFSIKEVFLKVEKNSFIDNNLIKNNTIKECLKDKGTSPQPDYIVRIIQREEQIKEETKQQLDSQRRLKELLYA